MAREGAAANARSAQAEEANRLLDEAVRVNEPRAMATKKAV